MMTSWDWISPLLETPLARWLEQLPEQTERVWRQSSHGDLQVWREAIQRLPGITLSDIDLQAFSVRAGRPGDCSEETRKQIIELLMQLHPWRKGPYEICGIHIDTEWRSDWKWDRIKAHIQPLEHRLVLDVGCGNGYHGWRMLGEGARQVLLSLLTKT